VRRSIKRNRHTWSTVWRIRLKILRLCAKISQQWGWCGTNIQAVSSLPGNMVWLRGFFGRPVPAAYRLSGSFWKFKRWSVSFQPFLRDHPVHHRGCPTASLWRSDV
jgi:hypothetical protein